MRSALGLNVNSAELLCLHLLIAAAIEQPLKTSGLFLSRLRCPSASSVDQIQRDSRDNHQQDGVDKGQCSGVIDGVLRGCILDEDTQGLEERMRQKYCGVVVIQQ